MRAVTMTGKPMAAMVWLIATDAAQVKSWKLVKSKILLFEILRRGFEGWIKRFSVTRKRRLEMMPLPSILPHQTMKKTPDRTARGIVTNTTRSGLVIVPMIKRPMRK